ncbi:hypothetical protein ASD85_18710 [Rhizobium sp. Root651]|nr:hypothetical protein ASD85_18710 [Rhizobium sp. Root651]
MPHLASLSASQSEVADFKNNRICLNGTLMFYQIKLPATMRFLHFRIIIPAFIKICLEIGIILRPGMYVVEKQIKLGERPRRNRIAGFDNFGCFFDPYWMNTASRPGFLQGNPQKCSLFVVAFDQIDPTIAEFRKKNSGNNAGETTTAA